jgi:hypothetical protein
MKFQLKTLVVFGLLMAQFAFSTGAHARIIFISEFATESVSFTLDEDNTGVGVDLDIIANQGSDNDGTIRYNSISNVWELSNDGGTFNSILSAGDISLNDAYDDLSTGERTIAVDDGDVSWNLTSTYNKIVDLQGTGDFIVQNGGTAFATFTDSGEVDLTGTLSVTGITDTLAQLDINTTGEAIEIGDGSAADVFITFAATSDHTLNWDESETDFDLSNMLDIAVSGEAIEIGDGTAADISINFDDDAGTDHTFGWDDSESDFDLTDRLDVQNTGEIMEGGDGTASNVYINFLDDGGENYFGWDNALEAESTFDEMLSFRTYQSATPPYACAAAYAGMQWMDTDTGITYSCDTSNGRNKWLSIGDMVIFGEESGSCAAGATLLGDGDCIITWGNGNGTDGNNDNIGFYLPHDATVVGYGFSADNDACTSGDFDAEVWSSGSNADDNNYTLAVEIETGLTGEAESSNVSNADVDGDAFIFWGIDNNCGQAIDDWMMVVYYRYRHD